MLQLSQRHTMQHASCGAQLCTAACSAPGWSEPDPHHLGHSCLWLLQQLQDSFTFLTCKSEQKPPDKAWLAPPRHANRMCIKTAAKGCLAKYSAGRVSYLKQRLGAQRQLEPPV